VAAKARTCIQDVVGGADRLLRMCSNLEDRYRDAGIAFHKTERAARLSYERNFRDHYANLEKAFLHDSYEGIFTPLTEIAKHLTKLRTRAQHVPSAAKADKLMLALRHELLPVMDASIGEFETFEQYISKLEADAHALQVFNRQFYQVNELGDRSAWYDPVLDIVNNKRTVRSCFGECTLFTDWVYSLPEAQRALEIQAELDGFDPSSSLYEDRLFVYSMDLLLPANQGLIADGGD
jgi:hypothetical protein